MNTKFNADLAEKNILTAFDHAARAQRSVIGRQRAISTMLCIFDCNMPCDVEIGLRLESQMLYERFHLIRAEQRKLHDEYVELFGGFDDDET